MEIRERREGNTYRLSLIGKLWHPDDIRTLRLSLNAVGESDISLLVVDLGRLSFMCSLGLGVLVRAFALLREKNIDFVLLAPTKNLREMITMSGLTSVIRIADSEKDVASPGSPAGQNTHG